MSEQLLLHVVGLTKSFPLGGGFWGEPKRRIQAVNHVDLSIYRGECFGLVGESGCGKTTLGRCIMRLLEPTAGEVHLEGCNILDLNPQQLRAVRQEMQIVFQDPYASLNPRKKVGRLITESLAIHRLMNRSQRKRRLHELLELVGLRPEHENRFPHEFSGGQRQRICIARALALNPKLIIADEPVSALDVSIQAQILNLLVELQDRLGLTYLFISHDLGVVRHICNRVAVMYMGRIIELAARDDLFERPAHPYTRVLLASIPTAAVNWGHFPKSLRGEVPSQINPPEGCPFHPRCVDRLEICTAKTPGLTEIKPGRWLACHLETPQ